MLFANFDFGLGYHTKQDPLYIFMILVFVNVIFD